MEQSDSAEFRSAAMEILARCINCIPCTPALRHRCFHGGSRIVGGCFSLIDNFMRLLGPLFVGLVWVLIGGIVVSWYMVLAPWLRQSRSLGAMAAHAIIAHWLLLNICFHYYKGTTTPPGSPPVLAPEVYRLGVQHKYRHCVKCQTLKPEKAHHCHVCQRCILDMDHHCPWLNNCVGHGNQRFFFLFMLFMWFGCLYVAVVASGPFLEFRRNHMYGAATDRTKEMQLAFCFVLTSAVIVALGILLLWHVYLVSNGCTTIVFFETKTARSEAAAEGRAYRNPYDLGFRRNWRLFLGLRPDMSAWRLMLPSNHAPIGDGLHWSHAKIVPDAEVV